MKKKRTTARNIDSFCGCISGCFKMISYGSAFESSRWYDTNLGLISRPNGEQGIWVGLNGGSSWTSVEQG